MPHIEEESSVQPAQDMQPAQEVRPGFIEGFLSDYAPSRTAILVYAYTLGYISAVTTETNDPARAVIEGGITGAFLYGIARLANSKIKY